MLEKIRTAGGGVLFVDEVGTCVNACGGFSSARLDTRAYCFVLSHGM